MPKRTVIYKKNGIEHKIEMSWGLFFKNFTVRFDGLEVGRFEGQLELNSGRDFSLPNGETLRVKKTQKMMTMLIEVLINGEPVEGTDSDPRTLVRNAYYVAIFLCALNVIVGSLAFFFKIDALTQLGFGWYNLIIGTLYFLPTFLGFRNKSWLMLSFILAIFLFDTVNAIYWIFELSRRGFQINGGTLVMRFIFGVPLFIGAKSGYLMKDKEPDPTK